MTNVQWVGEASNLIEAFRNNNKDSFIEPLKDNASFISALTISESDDSTLSSILKSGSLVLNKLVDVIVESDESAQMIYELGILSGVMRLSSQFCYERKKNKQINAVVKSLGNSPHFDRIIKLLSQRTILTPKELCMALSISPSALCDCLEAVLDTGLVACKRIGEHTAYILTDDGLRYAKELSSTKADNGSDWEDADYKAYRMNNEEKTKIAIEYLTELRDSRQKVLPNEAPYYEAEKDMDIFNIAIKALEERPHGEWITKNEYNHNCSLCGCSMLDKWDFCPNCGADMRGVHNA